MQKFYKASFITLSLLVSQTAISATFSPLPPGMFDVEPRVDLVSNYVWRGISQSDNTPSIQGGLTLTHKETNLYGALDIATIDRADHYAKNSSVEILASAGLKSPLFEATYDTKWLYYYYPDAVGLGWNEFLASVEYEWITAGISFSTNALNSASTGWYLHADAKWQLPQNSYFAAPPDFYLLGKVGRYLFNRGRYNHLNYTDYLIGIEKNFDKQFVAGAMLTATNRNFQGGGLDEMHLIFRLGASF